jgi:hypothetical protein
MTTLHRNLTGTELHEPKPHTHAEADITDMGDYLLRGGGNRYLTETIILDPGVRIDAEDNGAGATENLISRDGSDVTQVGHTDYDTNINSATQPTWGTKTLATLTNLAGYSPLGHSHPGYLENTAGPSDPLTGDLFLDVTSEPGVFLREAGSATSYSSIVDNGGLFEIDKHEPTGSATISIRPFPDDEAGASIIRLFSGVDTSGTVTLRLYDGTGPGHIQHEFDCGTGAADIAAYNAGDTNIGAGGGRTILGAPASAGATLFNGSISFYLDESGNNLKVEVKYSDGTAKTGTLALT